MSGFCHLHLHSEYSLLDGACRISDIPKKARDEGHSAVAITDHGAMYGVIEFYNACKEVGVKPIIGCEVYVAQGSRFDKSEGRTSSPAHLVLLCKNETGYKNLITMVSKGWTEGFYSKPRIDLELLRMHSDGLIALSGCLAGYIPRMIMAGNYRGASEYARTLAEIFGEDNFFLELQDHGLDDQKTVNAGLIRIAEENGIGLVATNDVHYLNRADADTQAILLCIQTNNSIKDGRPFGFETDEFYYKSSREMERLFGDIDGGSPITNTQRIADRCNLEFHFDRVYMPGFPFTDGIDPTVYLRRAADRGLDDKISRGYIRFDKGFSRDDYIARMDYEMSVISGMGYSEYYLVVADFIGYAKKNDIPVGPGRGSGAASLIAYLIGITDIDPLEYGLLFERFLNPERVSLPDFDVDFCYDRRDEVIGYVTEKYGREHVAQIITFGTMAARAAVRDVGRAMGMSYSDVDAIAKLIPREMNITLRSALDEPKLREMYDSSPDVKKLIDTAMALEGMPRHASTHAAGVIITSEKLSDIVPLAMSGETVVTQFDMDTAAKLGLVKFDFLALRYLTIISNTVKRIKRNDPDFDIALIPKDDAETYEMISSGETNGVFQLESAGMRRVLTDLKPTCFADIIASIALFRPGPMDSIPQYIKRKHEGGDIGYKMQEMSAILDETYGCIVYQEQVMQIFRAIAGYSFARADVVRRAMAKKKADVLESERGDFIKGALEHGMSERDANSLFDEMASFSSYAFNKSHAAAYAVISYETAFLKLHYTREYMASLLDSVLGYESKTAEYIKECEKRGIHVLPPDINESGADYTVGGDGIRFGLCALKGIGRQYVDLIERERADGGKFRSFYDFAVRMNEYDTNRRQAESLIMSGAFDRLGQPRSRLMASFDPILDGLHEKRRNGVSGQIDMFSSSDENGAAAPEFEYPEIPEFPRRKLLELEKQVSGMYFSGHILDDYERECALVSPVMISDIRTGADDGDDDDDAVSYDGIEDHARVTVVGLVTKRTVKTTKKGDRMMFMSLSDKTGEIEVIVFPRMLTNHSAVIMSDDPIVVSGEVSFEEDKPPKIILGSCCLLTDAGVSMTEQKRKVSYPDEKKGADNRADEVKTSDKAQMPKKLYVRVGSMNAPEWKRAKGLIEIFCGQMSVYVYEKSTEKYTRLEDFGADPGCARLIRELSLLLGEENVVIK